MIQHIFLIILLLYLTTSPQTYRKDVNINKTKIMSIRILARQASRWATAAKQDENAMIAVLHANYGAAYLWALKDIATDNEIEQVIGIDVLQFRNAIIKIQDDATKKMAMLCPRKQKPT